MKQRLAPFTEATIFDWDVESANDASFDPPVGGRPRRWRQASRQGIGLLTLLLVLIATLIGGGIVVAVHVVDALSALHG